MEKYPSYFPVVSTSSKKSANAVLSMHITVARFKLFENYLRVLFHVALDHGIRPYGWRVQNNSYA